MLDFINNRHWYVIDINLLVFINDRISEILLYFVKFAIFDN